MGTEEDKKRAAKRAALERVRKLIQSSPEELEEKYSGLVGGTTSLIGRGAKAVQAARAAEKIRKAKEIADKSAMTGAKNLIKSGGEDVAQTVTFPKLSKPTPKAKKSAPKPDIGKPTQDFITWLKKQPARVQDSYSKMLRSEELTPEALARFKAFHTK